jgi:OOP family OmpA-OmpF porin
MRGPCWRRVLTGVTLLASLGVTTSAQARPGAVEFGGYGGVLLLSHEHELFLPNPERPQQGFAPVRVLSPNVGLRLGYYPIPFLGFEAEGGISPSRLREREGDVLLYTARGQLVGRLALWRVMPLLLVGGGVLGVHSKPELLGDDRDAALHFGGGLDVFVTRRLLLRFDVRDLVSWRHGVEPSFGAHSLEVTLGLSVSLP